MNAKSSELNIDLTKARDIIENRGTKALEEKLSLLHATMQSRKDGIIVLNHNNAIVDYNKSAIKLLKLQEEDLVNTDISNLINKVCKQTLFPVILKNTYDESTRDHDDEHHAEIQFKDKSIVEFYAYPQHHEGKYIGRILQFRDLTKIKLNEHTLIKKINHDSLTQLPGQELLTEILNQTITNARRNRLPLSVLICDIDKFKNINDHLGQTIGDKVLQAVAERLQTSVASGCTVARLSANKFAIIYCAGKNENDITYFTKNCLENMDIPYVIEGNSVNAPISIGIANYPKDGDDATTLLKNADIAMHRAKKQGGATSQFFTDELNKKHKERLMVENHLRNALKLNEFKLQYHPIMDVTEKRIVGVEVLLRWHHPILGDASPATFVPIAEQNGMILPIGYWILETGAEQIKKWQALGMDCYLSFNISSKQFNDPKFIDELKSILLKTKLAPNHIAIEITERMLMDNIDDKISTLTTLKRFGITIIVDDFGTGFSCLGVLNTLPIDILKIDNSFVEGIGKPESEKMIACICALAAHYNFGLIAEGVTSDKQEKFLLELNCTRMQGYRYHKPLSAEAITREMTKEKIEASTTPATDVM